MLSVWWVVLGEICTAYCIFIYRQWAKPRPLPSTHTQIYLFLYMYIHIYRCLSGGPPDFLSFKWKLYIRCRHRSQILCRHSHHQQLNTHIYITPTHTHNPNTHPHSYTCSDCFVQHFFFYIFLLFCSQFLLSVSVFCIFLHCIHLGATFSLVCVCVFCTRVGVCCIEKFTMQLSMQILPTCHVDKYTFSAFLLPLSFLLCLTRLFHTLSHTYAIAEMHMHMCACVCYC